MRSYMAEADSQLRLSEILLRSHFLYEPPKVLSRIF